MAMKAPITRLPVVSRLGRDRTPNGVVEADRSGLEILDRGECLRLLATATLGRLGITVDALPVIVPVNFRLVGDGIAFRAGIGTKLHAATRNAVVAFEVDHLEPLAGTGWSVAVTGVAREAADPDELAELRQARIPRWTEWGGDRFIIVSTDMVSGRRIPPGRNAEERAGQDHG